MSGHAHPDELTDVDRHRVGLCVLHCPVCAREEADKTRATELAALRIRAEELVEVVRELMGALKGLGYEDDIEGMVYCDHAAPPCNRCNAARAALSHAEKVYGGGDK